MNNINIYIHVQPEESTSSVPLVSKKSLKDYKLNS